MKMWEAMYIRTLIEVSIGFIGTNLELLNLQDYVGIYSVFSIVLHYADRPGGAWQKTTDVLY